MTIEIPDDIADDFLNLLDVAQATLTSEDVSRLCPEEQKCLAFVEKMLGDRASARFDTRKQQHEAAASLVNLSNL